MQLLEWSHSHGIIYRVLPVRHLERAAPERGEALQDEVTHPCVASQE